MLTHSHPPQDVTSYHPIDKVLSYENLTDSHCIFCAMFLQSLSLHIFIKQSNLNLGEILWMKRLMQWSEQILGVFFLFSMALLINITLTWLQRDIVSNKVLILLLPFHLLLRL